MSSTSDTGSGMPNSGRRTIAVLISLVDDNPFNARIFYDGAVVARLSREIRADGQLVAAMAIPSTSNSNRFTLIDGHYRLQAIRAAGLSTIQLDVRDAVPNVELFRLSFTLNEHRAPHTALDNALAWRRILDSGDVVSHEALSAITGKSGATISKTLQMLEMPADVLQIVKAHPNRFNFRVGYALTQICKAGGVTQAKKLAKRAITEDVTTTEVDQHVIKAQGGMRTLRPRTGSQKVQVNSTACVGTIKRWESGKVSIELTFAEPARACLMIEQLKHLVLMPT